ncbi:TIGR01440 family protein [Caldalkalibacillus salinus]|uniref:TIGR01440 family protein n=1 Tax=Caldalkalibacillus salinus TaxID=2803787 RepID=UPI0019205BFF|nr:TIGR01440 family protein [Caldalkalibacillus salinus]
MADQALRDELYHQTKQALEALHSQFPLQPHQLIVFGVSTSEVLGARIGTAGTEGVASAIFQAIANMQQQHGFQMAFQCCEHLNRALVVERHTALQRGYEEVTVVPVPQAGGAMASYAYHALSDPVMVEEVQAEAGIDIGDTLIGMHLKRVAVPIRSEIKSIGHAHVTMAITRPKLIGGARATYELVQERE